MTQVVVPQTELAPFTKPSPTHPINFNNLHLMPLNPEEEHGKPSRVQDAQTLCLPAFERQGRVFVEADFIGGRVCMRTRLSYVSEREEKKRLTGNRRQVLTVFRKVDESIIRNGLCTTWVTL